MGRSRLGVLTALALTLAGRAGAAEITDIASRTPGKPFDLRVTLRWDRFQEHALITREVPTAEGPVGAITNGDDLRYSRTVNTVVPRVALGVTEDLEAHFEWPYVLGDDRVWRYGSSPSSSPPTIDTNTINANGIGCTSDGTTPITCPLFPVAPETTVFHGGKAGDLKAGLAWGIFDDKLDPTKPFWLVGLDVTFPTAARYDPVAGRDLSSPSTPWISPHSVPGNPAPVGEKVWRWDLHTVLSKRIGPIDPYVKAHVTLVTKSSSTYSNCEHAAELAGRPNGNGWLAEMNSNAVAGCAAEGRDADAKLPWIAGITFGTELVPYENPAEQQRVAVDFRVFADYTSSQRFYNELTDANGKLNWTDDYLTMGGYFGVYLRASKYVSLQGTASLSTATPHWLTGESMGDPSQPRPNFDWRYDAPGRRFRISEVANFGMSFAGVLTF
jgi:hypothetical protein